MKKGPVINPEERTDGEISGGNKRTAFERYLKEIGRIPLFTREQEIRMNGLLLSARKEFNRALRAKKKDPKNRELREKFLAAKKKLQAVKNEYASHNLRLVVSMARSYRAFGSMEDRVQNGNQGLMKALKKFDPTRGYRFSTYASWWIRQSMIREHHDTGHTIRRPVHIGEDLNRLYRAQNEAANIPVNGKSGEELLCLLTGFTREKLRKILVLQNSADPLSLDAHMDAEGSTTFASFISDQSVHSPEENTDREQIISIIRELILQLDPRDQLIIRSRFGIVGNDRVTAARADKDEPTLEEVGAILGITRERVRQLQDKALKTLRAKYKNAS